MPRVLKTIRIFVVAGVFHLAALAQSPETPLRSILDPGVITTRQQVTPAGTQTVFAGRVYGLTFGKTDSEIYVLSGVSKTPLYQINWKENRIEKAYFKNRVFIKQPEREGRGDTAEYYAKEDKIILVGNLAQVDSKSKGKSIGKRLTIYNNGDKIFIE